MRLRRLLFFALLAAGAFALLRRRSAEDTNADVWFDDGSSVSLARSSPAGERLGELAEAVLAEAP
jgi:hypothetical protein